VAFILCVWHGMLLHTIPTRADVNFIVMLLHVPMYAALQRLSSISKHLSVKSANSNVQYV